MQRILLTLIFFISIHHIAFAQQTRFKNGMTIKKSAVIDSSHYNYNAKSKSKPVLTIQGKNIVIDFQGATLDGSGGRKAPDQYSGTAIQVKKGTNITIKNLKITGYKNAIVAKDVNGLKFENCDFTDQKRRPLSQYGIFYQLHTISNFNIHSLLEHAIQLNGCRNIEIAGCRASANENVLSLVNCSSAIIYNNDFSFNSGAAVVLTNSDHIQLLYNRFNFNVADTLLTTTAAVVMDGLSSYNIIYKNSITHAVNGMIIGGNAAGKVKGKEARNLIMENDLSFNISSGIRSYHTDAIINKNRIFESNTGNLVVAPSNQVISNNQYRFNQIAIDISGIGTSTIHHNLFLEDRTALRMSFYGKSRAGHANGVKAIVVANSFNRNRVVFDLNRVDAFSEFNNLFQQFDTLFKADTSMMNVDVEEDEDLLVELSEDIHPSIKEPASAQNPFKGNGRFAGRGLVIPM
nr:right-handed parallel beta-helix repeat-containing protein [Flavisolibacter sp.]